MGVTTPSPLPVISLEADPSIDDRAALHRRLHEACTGAGFFYLQHDPALLPLIHRAMAGARSFFSLPLATKMQVGENRQEVFPRISRGYTPSDFEILNGAEGTDIKEAFDLGFEMPMTGLPFEGPTVFPDAEACPDFRKALLDLQAAVMGTLYPSLLQALLVALDIDCRDLRDICRKPTLLQRVQIYPANGGSAGSHTDNGIFTILIQEETDQPALFVQSGGGWLPVPAKPSTVIVNIGDMLQMMTDDRVVSTPHYVANQGNASRISIAFFCYPHVSARFRAPGSGKTYAVQDIMLKNYQSIYQDQRGAGRAESLGR